MTAAVALDPHKAVIQLAAAQVVLELGQHEAGQRALVTLQLIPQGRQMSLDDRIERFAQADGAGTGGLRRSNAGRKAFPPDHDAWRTRSISGVVCLEKRATESVLLIGTLT